MPRERNKIFSKAPIDKRESQEEKEFESVEIILMLLITGMSDLGDIVGLLVLPIPIIGQIIFFLAKGFSFVVWIVIQLWLVFKGVNKSGPSLSKMATKPSTLTKFIFSGGSALDLIGMPFGQTLSLGLTIYLANHPKLAGLAEKVAITAATGGAGGALVVAEEGAGKIAAQAGARAMAKRAVQVGGRAAMRAGKNMAQEAAGDLVGDGRQGESETGGGDQSNEALGEVQNPFEELEGLTSEVQGEEDVKFANMAGRARREKKRSEFIDIAGRNANREEEERRAA